MSSDLRQVMSQVIGQLCYQVGFDRITESALDLLIEVGVQYIQNLAHTVAKVSNLCGDGAQLEDGILALRLLRQSPQNLLKFVEDVGPYFSAAPATCTIPLQGKVCLNVPPEDHEELNARPDYIPEHLPLCFIESEPADSELSIFAPHLKSTGSPIAKANCSQPEPTNSSTNNLTSLKATVASTTGIVTTTTTTTTRVLPAWAQQASYKIARVSIDPVTKTLVEHAPPEKIQDLSHDIPTSRAYGLGAGTSMYAETSRSDSKLNASNGPVLSTSYRQGATDEQWAAALQATPVARPAKRIVYTPSRFDPSSVPSYASSVRRSNSTALFSTATRRGSVSQSLDVSKKRPAHAICAPSAKVPKLSTSNRRRRGAFGRARQWARRRNFKKDDKTNKSSNLPGPSNAVVQSEDILQSPFTEKTPELKTDARSPSPVSPGFDYGQADSGSDRTPPATSPLAALRLHKSDETESAEVHQVPTSMPESIDANVKCEDVLREPPDGVDKLAYNSLTSAVTDSPAKSLPRLSPKAAASTTFLSPASQPESVEQLNAAPVSFPSLVCARLRGRKKGRGRKRPTSRPSIISSLFQNPLRKKAPTKGSSNSNAPINKAEASGKPVINAPITEKSPVVVKVEGEEKQQEIPVVTSKDAGKKSSRLRGKCTRNTSDQTASRQRADDTRAPLNTSNINSTHSSPASDSTEPMIDEARANLLLMPHSSPEKRLFDNHSTSSQTTVLVKDSSTKIDTNKSALNSVPFPGKNFEKLRNPAPITVRALASSPSSLESSPTSSISSTSTSLLDEPVDMKMESRDLTSTSLVEPINAPPDLMDSNDLKPDVRLIPVTSSKEAHPLSEDVALSISSSSSLNSSTVSSVTSTGPPPGSNPPGPPPPPPLLPLTRQTFDASLFAGSTLPTRNIGMHNNSTSIPPPSLVPVMELPTPPVSSEPMSVTGEPHTSATSLPSNTPGGLRIKIRFGASEVRESATSSLSPSSSSSSLSSGSTPSSPYIPERMPAPVCGPTGSPSIRPPTVAPKEFTSSTMDSKPLTASPASEPPTAAKTPKLVIRLGANTQTNTQNRNQPPKLWSTEKATTESFKGQVAPNMDFRGSSSTTMTQLTPPPPLQLTITRDRLSYRGRTASEVSDSNVSSSSGTESLLSSGEDDDSLKEPPNHNMLPPPPSLERLPSRTDSVLGNPASATTTFDTPNHSSSSRNKHASVSTTCVAPTTLHTQLPPLLPLFSIPAERDVTRAISTPPRLPSLDDFPEGDVSNPPGSQNNIRSIRKRQRSTRKHVGSSSKRRFVSADPSPSSVRQAASDKPNMPGNSQARVRVDSVFTDNESDENTELPMPDLISVNPATRDTSDPIRTVRDTNNEFSPTIPKQHKTQPRTKQTTIFPKSAYSPAIKAAVTSAPAPTVTLSKNRTSRKHLPSSSSSTGSSGMKSRAPLGSHRPSSSQVVVASAGSSYYFNSSGEQIWLCPVCLLEDDGNLMIGCDSCDDWYHSTCLGLSAEPEDPHWFCPRCAGQPLPVNTGPTVPVSVPVQLPPIPPASVPSSAGQKKKSESGHHRSTPNSSSKGFKRRAKR